MEIKSIHLPDLIEWEAEASTNTFGRLVISPLERGFGRTLGNSLRRVLLSSLEGAAPVSVTIDGVLHEFTALSGMVQDVPDIILNIKGLEIAYSGEDGPGILNVKAKGPAKITAADLKYDDSLEILNKDLPIAEIAEGGSLKMVIKVENNRGYVTSDDWQKMGRGKEIGEILLDSWFGPVKKVNFIVESARVGDRTDFDKLIMEITTNGTVLPADAVKRACGILIEHFNLLTDESKPVEESVKEPVEEEQELVDLPLTETSLTPRLINCLAGGNIHTLSELAGKTKKDLLALRNFGLASFQSVADVLREHDYEVEED